MSVSLMESFLMLGVKILVMKEKEKAKQFLINQFAELGIEAEVTLDIDIKSINTEKFMEAGEKNKSENNLENSQQTL